MEIFCFVATILGLVSTFCNAQQHIQISVQLNQDAILPCMLESAEGVSVRWFNKKDGWLSHGTVIYKHQNSLKIEKPAPNEWNLRIQRVTSSFADEYTCQTDQGVPIIIITLVIETPPKIDEIASSPFHVHFSEHEYAEVTCEASGIPDPVISWFRGTTANNPEIGIIGKKLIFTEITRYASDVYICRATNEHGQVERQINVSVTFPPEVTVMEPEVFAAGEDMAVMSCAVQGSPLYESYWVKGLDTGGNHLYTNYRHIVHEEEAGDGIPVKFITVIFRRRYPAGDDYDTYTCVARGNGTQAQASTLVRPIGEKPHQAAEEIITYN